MNAAVMSRHPVSLVCLLARAAGSPIAARTSELGMTGMRVVVERPLALDETLSVQLGDDEAPITGRARVVCQHRSDAYTLRFEPLSEPIARRLQEVVEQAGHAG